MTNNSNQDVRFDLNRLDQELIKLLESRWNLLVNHYESQAAKHSFSPAQDYSRLQLSLKNALSQGQNVPVDILVDLFGHMDLLARQSLDSDQSKSE